MQGSVPPPYEVGASLISIFIFVSLCMDVNVLRAAEGAQLWRFGVARYNFTYV